MAAAVVLAEAQEIRRRLTVLVTLWEALEVDTAAAVGGPRLASPMLALALVALFVLFGPALRGNFHQPIQEIYK